MIIGFNRPKNNIREHPWLFQYTPERVKLPIDNLVDVLGNCDDFGATFIDGLGAVKEILGFRKYFAAANEAVDQWILILYTQTPIPTNRKSR